MTNLQNTRMTGCSAESLHHLYTQLMVSNHKIQVYTTPHMPQTRSDIWVTPLPYSIRYKKNSGICLIVFMKKQPMTSDSKL